MVNKAQMLQLANKFLLANNRDEAYKTRQQMRMVYAKSAQINAPERAEMFRILARTRLR